MTDDAAQLIADATSARDRFTAVLRQAGLEGRRLEAATSRMRARLPASRLRQAEREVMELLEPEEPRRERAGSSPLSFPVGIRA